MKNLKKSAFSLLAGLFLLFSCDDFTEDTAGENSVLPNDGRAYICVREAGSSKSLRTALPSFTEDGIADFTFTIKGKKTGDTGPEEVLGSFDTLSALKDATIAIESGTWNFSLTAEKDGSLLSGKLENKEISAASNPNQLSFELSWDKSTLEGEGSLSFSLDFSQASNSTSVQCATGQLLKYDSESGSETELPDYPEKELSILDADDKPLFKAVYELSDIDAGIYRIKIRLYADSEKKNLIVTWPELAIITGGQESSASRECNSLNEVYSITYNNPLEAVPVDGSSLQEAYTRYSGDIVLPDLEKEGYTFEGWFDNEDCSGEALEVIEGGSTGDKVLWARWLLPNLYIAKDAIDGDGTDSKPFGTFDEAFAWINDADTDYTIYIDGTLTGQQSIPSSIDGKAKSLTLTGKNALVDGVPQDVLDADGANDSVLNIKTSVPVTIINLKITGGTNGVYVGYDFETSQYLNSDVTFGSGCLIKDNGNSSGVYISAGKVTLDGGVITDNSCEQGGGVAISGGEFILKSGTIAANISEIAGAGVYITGGKFTMKGGTISGNLNNNSGSLSGAGVYVGTEDENSGTFIMEDGIISGNISFNSGGGVYVDSNATFEMKGGSITGNKFENINLAENGGNGIYLASGDGAAAIFKISGDAVVASDNDVYLSEGTVITVAGSLTGTNSVATITPADYNTETTVLAVDADTGLSLSDVYSRFALTAIENGDTLTVWNLTSEGKLNKLDSISSEDELRLVASLLTNGKTVELDVTGSIQIYEDFAVPEGATIKLNRASDYKDVLIAPDDDIVIGSETSGKLILDGGYDGTDSGISSEGPLAGGFTGAVYYNVIFQNNFNKGSTEAGLPNGYSGRGGAVSAWNSTSGSAKNLRMYNCTINNCKALYGGALFISGGAQDSGKLADGLVNVTISNCVATVQGGAIYRDEMLSESTIKLNGCTITGCTAGNGSGSGNIFYIKAFSNNFVEHTCHLYVDGSLLKDVGRDSSPYVVDKLTYGNKTAPDSVGDIVFSDGSAVAYSEDLTLTSAQQAAAVAVIYYIGSSSPDTSTIEGRLFSQLGVKKLGVGLKNSSSIETTDEKRFQWATEESYLYSNSVSVSGISYAFDTSSGITGAWSSNTEYIVFTSGSDFDGSDNFAAIKTALGTNDDTGVTGRYPAWDWINSYTTYADNLSGTAYSSGWYMPTMPEICPLMNNIEVINSALLKAGGTAIDDAWFVTSNYDGSISAAWQGTILSNKSAKEDYDVLAVRVFE